MRRCSLVEPLTSKQTMVDVEANKALIIKEEKEWSGSQLTNSL
jgi:hypothetical protein